MLAKNRSLSDQLLPFVDNPSPKLQRLDRRISWTHGLAVVSHGVACGVRTNSAAALEAIHTALPAGAVPFDSTEVTCLFSYRQGGLERRPNVRTPHRIFDLHETVARTYNQLEALDALEGILQINVAHYAPQRVFIHAGVVGWRGRAIVIPGRSFAGKSTLVAALLRAGAEYYSDEYAVLDGAGSVWPYPRRLALRQPNTRLPFRRTAADLGATTGVRPLPVGVVAFTRFLPGAAWKPRRISGGKAVLGLFDNALAAQRDADRCLSAIQCVAENAQCVESSRGDAAVTAERLLSLLD